MSSSRLQALPQMWPANVTADVLFILRTVIAMLLALAIAFRLDLSTPGSAAVTVSIIALPQVGMVLEKSVYRLLGTLLGACAALFIVGIFAQHQYSFIVAIALWIGVCTAASEWFRGFGAYGWLLSGYTAYLVGFDAFIDVPHAFDIAVDRVAIVSVGILSSGIVNATFFPTRSALLLDDRLAQVVRDCTALFAAATAADPATLHRKQSRFALDLGELESIRRSSAFENPVSRLRTPGVLLLIEHLTLLLGHLQIVSRQLQSLPEAAGKIRQHAMGILSRCHEILLQWQTAPAGERRTRQAVDSFEQLLKETPLCLPIAADCEDNS
ncbi:MAG TPA: FUSC family protein, partial [Steroidobacteraceae bacterium]